MFRGSVTSRLQAVRGGSLPLYTISCVWLHSSTRTRTCNVVSQPLSTCCTTAVHVLPICVQRHQGLHRHEPAVQVSVCSACLGALVVVSLASQGMLKHVCSQPQKCSRVQPNHMLDLRPRKGVAKNVCSDVGMPDLRCAQVCARTQRTRLRTQPTPWFLLTQTPAIMLFLNRLYSVWVGPAAQRWAGTGRETW